MSNFSQRLFLSFQVVPIMLKSLVITGNVMLKMVCVPISMLTINGAARDWSDRCMGGNVISVEIAVVPNYVTRTRWRRLYAGYLGFIFVK